MEDLLKNEEKKEIPREDVEMAYVKPQPDVGTMSFLSWKT